MAEAMKLKLSPRAAQLLIEALSSGDPSDHAVRVRARKVGLRRFSYSMDVVEEADLKDDDLSLSLEEGKVLLYLDPESVGHLDGATIDFVDLGGLQGAGFKFDNPNEKPSFGQPVELALQKLLDEEINPSLASHGGFVELLRVEGGDAYVSMGGGCQGCGQASATMRNGVETKVKEQLPEIRRLVDVTDHAAGETPYFS